MFMFLFQKNMLKPTTTATAARTTMTTTTTKPDEQIHDTVKKTQKYI